MPSALSFKEVLEKRLKICFTYGMDEALERAKQAIGGATALSRAMNSIVTPQAVSQWKKVPGDRVLEVERITGVSRHELRPDIFGKAKKEQAA